MLHARRQLELDGGRSVAVGYTVCFSTPSLSLVIGERRASPGPPATTLLASVSLTRDQADALIAAPQAVRDAMPVDGR
jgi:hypothetical protein